MYGLRFNLSTMQDYALPISQYPISTDRRWSGACRSSTNEGSLTRRMP
jgi:hypothetical protein